jgi:hypothetical protein
MQQQQEEEDIEMAKKELRLEYGSNTCYLPSCFGLDPLYGIYRQ